MVIPIDDWGIAEESELSRVTKLTPKSSNSDNGASTATAGYTSWVSSARVAGAIYYGDSLKDIGTSRYKKISEIGAAICAKLTSKGMLTVGDVVEKMGAAMIDDLVKAFPKLKVGKLTELVGVCSSAIPTAVPKEIDHTNSANPYKSRYGDVWKDELATALYKKGKVCVTELVTHIVRESEKVYANTKYKDTWRFYHDALSLMTAKSCIAWMKTQKVREGSDVTFLDKWILPQNGLNDQFKRFKGRPIGNSPEMMPLDNCLNKDLHEAVSRHILMSRASAIKKDDPRIFSLKTPKQGASSYTRIWNPTNGGVAPPSNRIIQDIKKVVAAMKQIGAAKGAFVPNLAQRPGDRHIINQLNSKIWGGKRTKKEYVSMLLKDRTDLHDDLKAILKESDESGEGFVVLG